MTTRRPVKLLNQTTAFYLIFTFLVFFVSAFILSKMANHYIDSYVQSRFSKYENRLKHHLQKDSTLSHLPRYLKVKKVSDLSILKTLPIIKDTLIYSDELDEYLMYRKRKAVIQQGTQYFTYMARVRVGDFYRLRDDFLASMFIVFGVLAFGMIVFNYFLSGYLFKPFNQILEVMRTYKVGQGAKVQKVYTVTEEFIKMQDLFHQMLEQIEKDYRNLKEYTEDMAHEMQTPIAIMRSKMESLMSDETLLQKHGPQIKTIYQQLNHLSRLGNTLNLLTRIENGEFQNKKTIRTKDIIEEHLKFIQELAELKHLQFVTDLSEGNVFTIDPYLFELILKNLLRNAIQHAPENSKIFIKTDENQLLISNAGAELDFPPEKLFKRFVKRKSNGETLGLGLALVKKICDLNNLQIDYQYQDGQHVFRVWKSS